jgi:hypothetical protein
MNATLLICLDGVWCAIYAMESPVQALLGEQPRPLNEDEAERVTGCLSRLSTPPIQHLIISRN